MDGDEDHMMALTQARSSAQPLSDPLMTMATMQKIFDRRQSGSSACELDSTAIMLLLVKTRSRERRRRSSWNQASPLCPAGSLKVLDLS
eukprot:757895-Hanusia_phi.AAC.2